MRLRWIPFRRIITDGKDARRTRDRAFRNASSAGHAREMKVSVSRPTGAFASRRSAAIPRCFGIAPRGIDPRASGRPRASYLIERVEWKRGNRRRNLADNLAVLSPEVTAILPQKKKIDPPN